MSETPDLNLLRIFVAVADEESFSRAADRLGIAKGTVSRSIARLEETLGAQVLHRTTHSVALSTAGEALYERVASHVRALETASRSLPDASAEPAGHLRITAPNDFGIAVLPEVIARFGLRYPDVSFSINLSNERFDLVADGFDLAIRATSGPLQDSSLQVRRLGRFVGKAYASPTYLARRGTPSKFGEEGHDWIGFHGVQPGEAFRYEINDFFALKNLIVAGAGVGMLPALIADPFTRTGELVRVLTDFELRDTANVWVLYPSSGQVAPKVAAFRDFLLEHFGG